MPGSVFHLIPHTHWDREWYLPRAAFVARLVPMMDDLIARLEADPAFATFLLDGQTVLIEDYLDIRPEQAGAVRSLVRAGRLQTGPWYVLADELIPSGESLIRNLLIGSAQARALGDRSRALYSPDAFGHPAAWPSLGREFGLAHGALWRGRRGDTDLFRWRAPDGAELLVYHLPPAGYEIGAALPSDADRLEREWPAVRDAVVRRAATRHVAIFVGADHHAAHPDLPRLRQLLGALEGDNEVRISRLDELLAAAGAEAAELPVVTGELRAGGHTWALQGIHATRAPLKRRNAVCELWLSRYAEPLAALARTTGGSDRRPLLGAAWRELVRSHFHDALGGCCADAVAADVRGRQDDVAAIARELVRASVAELAGYDPDRARDQSSAASPTLVCWNPAARRRGGVVIADVTFFRRDVLVGPPSGRRPRRGSGYAPFALRSADGQTIPVQVLERESGLERLNAARHYPDLDEVDRVRIAFDAPPIGGMEVATLAAVPSPAAATGAVSVRGRTLSNGTLDATLEADGSVTLRERRSGQRYAGLLRLESEGDAGDTYTFAPVPGSLLRADGLLVRPRIVARGPLAAAVEGRWSFAGVAVRLRLILLAGESFARCVLDLDNRAVNRRLRLRVPVGIESPTAVAGTDFGTIERAVEMTEQKESVYDGPAETPVATAPAHRYVAAARGGRGLAVLAPGFFEYEWTASDLAITLLRSVGDLSRGDLATRPGHAGWVTPTPGAQCLGRDRIELALAPITASDLERTDRLERTWEDAFLPVRGMWLRDADAQTPAAVGVELEGEGLVLSAVKPAEDGDGMILRCWNAGAAATIGRARVRPQPRQAERSLADEREGEPIPLDADGSVPFRAGPREIVTLRLR